MSKPPAIFSFFSGAGFLDLGFELSGYEIVYVNEIHKPFMDCYRHSREVLRLHKPRYDYQQYDITNLIEGQPRSLISDLLKECKNTADIVGFIGGPPCPDFSVGGKNRGREGDNGKLSATYVELILQQKPDFFLFENVKGLWRTKIHRAFYEEMKHLLHLAGYITTEKLINAIEYGVPQDRERIMLVGFKDILVNSMGIRTNGSKCLDEGIFPWEKHTKYNSKGVFLYPWIGKTPFQEDSAMQCPEDIPKELTVEYWFQKNDVYNHPNGNQHFKPRAGIAKFSIIPEGDVSKKSYKRLHRWRYSPTACYGNNEVHLHPYKIRRISVAEALAIQSLPEGYTIPESMSLSNAFKTVGNGVPFLASKAIAETILDFLGVIK